MMHTPILPLQHFSVANVLAMMMPQRKPSKYYREGIADTGKDAASALRLRRNLHAGRGSTLRKLQRILRVEAGLRPQRFATTRPTGRAQ